MRKSGSVVILGLFALLLTPGLARASSLELECSAEQSIPGRVLVCDYYMLRRLNAELAELQDEAVLSGRAGSNDLKRWTSARDACQDVACLDRLFENGIHETRLTLAAEENSKRPPLLVNARGVRLRVLDANPAPTSTVIEPPEAREPSTLETAASLLMVLFLVAALGYALVARRLAA